MKGIRQMQKAAFNGFDPDQYDPSIGNKYNNADSGNAGSSVQEALPGQKMQVNLSLSNPTAQNLTFELFQWLDSMTKRLKAEYVVSTYRYIPMISYEGIKLTAQNTTLGVVGWDQNGNCVIYGSTTAADPVATIGCGEIAYRSFFEASSITPFKVAYIRYTCNTQNQIDQQIAWFSKSYSGGTNENKISPRAYFRPNQYQSLTIDITVEFNINLESGLRHIVLAGESVRMSLFIQFWTDQSL